MENTLEHSLKPRNVFVKASDNDMAKLDKKTLDNLKQSFLAMNIYNGCLKDYNLEKAGFSYVGRVIGAGDDTYGDDLRDTRRANDYIHRSFDGMGLHDAAKNYLLGDQDQNSANENRALEKILNKAIGMINPYKVPAKSDEKIRKGLKELNDEYTASTNGLVQELKDKRIFERIMSAKNTKPTLIGRVRLGLS